MSQFEVPWVKSTAGVWQEFGKKRKKLIICGTRQLEKGVTGKRGDKGQTYVTS